MGTVPVGKTVEVVPNEEEAASVILWPPKGLRAEAGTLTLPAAEFARGLRAFPRRCAIALG